MGRKNTGQSAIYEPKGHVMLNLFQHLPIGLPGGLVLTKYLACQREDAESSSA